MKIILIFCLLAYLSLSQQTLLVSSPSTTSVQGFQVAENTALNTVLDPHGTGAKWIWTTEGNNGQSIKSGTTRIFVASFLSDCPHKIARLTISADDSFSAYINGDEEKQMKGTDSQIIYTFDINLQCGLNNLTIAVFNVGTGDNPVNTAGIIFSIIQDQTDCYKCQNNGGSFYNRTTCDCQCYGGQRGGCNCQALNPRYVWTGYPTCSCGCGFRTLALCQQPKYYDEGSCQCQCVQKNCVSGYIFNQDVCKCQKQCKQTKCPLNHIFDFEFCGCRSLCDFVEVCQNGKEWSLDLCACVFKITSFDQIPLTKVPQKPIQILIPQEIPLTKVPQKPVENEPQLQQELTENIPKANIPQTPTEDNPFIQAPEAPTGNDCLARITCPVGFSVDTQRCICIPPIPTLSSLSSNP